MHKLSPRQPPQDQARPQCGARVQALAPQAARLPLRLSILKRFVNNPILKKDLSRVPGLSKLSILRQFQGTNFPVRDSEWKAIAQLM